MVTRLGLAALRGPLRYEDWKKTCEKEALHAQYTPTFCHKCGANSTDQMKAVDENAKCDLLVSKLRRNGWNIVNAHTWIPSRLAPEYQIRLQLSERYNLCINLSHVTHTFRDVMWVKGDGTIERIDPDTNAPHALRAFARNVSQIAMAEAEGEEAEIDYADTDSDSDL